MTAKRPGSKKGLPERKKSKMSDYVGTIRPDSGRMVTFNGQPLNPKADAWEYNWGYGGSGPHALARAILRKYFRSVRGRELRQGLVDQYKHWLVEDMVSLLPGSQDFAMVEATITFWLAYRMGRCSICGSLMPMDGSAGAEELCNECFRKVEADERVVPDWAQDYSCLRLYLCDILKAKEEAYDS